MFYRSSISGAKGYAIERPTGWVSCHSRLAPVTFDRATLHRLDDGPPILVFLLTDSPSLLQLKDRNGSSRQSLKKYVKANNQINTVSDNMFDSLFNKALRAGVEKGVFEQPKGTSPPVYLSITLNHC